MQPSAYSTPGTLSGNTGLTFGTGWGAGVGAVDVEASASVAREAVVETLLIVTLEAVSDASSLLSVSPRSKGGLIAGAPSRKSKGRIPYLCQRSAPVESRALCSQIQPRQ